jgi:hypothetical protein
VGFAFKLDNGDIKLWGNSRDDTKSGWYVNGGPIVGYIYDNLFVAPKHYTQKFGLVIGNECRPKYLGSISIRLRQGAKTYITFFW